MGTNQLQIVGAGLFFLFIFLTGYRLSRSRKPYSMVVLAIHKLISLAAVALLVITLYQMNRAAGLSAAELVAGVITGLFLLGTMATGGLLSTAKPMPAIVHTLHKITPFLALLSNAVTLVLLLSRKG